MSIIFTEGEFDAVVVGAGHAGCEAALALARTGMKTAILSLNLENIAFLACNPSIGGTAKGHLVRELDALGGEMGVNADKTLLQLRMLNRGKGAAVHSLRAQADKNRYHTEMKKTLESTPNLTVLQSEAVDITTENGAVTGVVTAYGGLLKARAVVLATGVYLKSAVFAGEFRKEEGPSGFSGANGLTDSLLRLGFSVRRFKTGTPARIDGNSIDYSKCELQPGETDVYPFSSMTMRLPVEQVPCYLTYTNQKTHDIIRANLHRSPLYGGAIKGIGPRYCPSIEDKVVRFADKERHQIFLEPEGGDTNEVYVQGMSSSLPHDVQRDMYHTIAGLENCRIMRYAYAIEYDCIDTLDLYPTLEFKKVKGLYCAGQINGSSGYEEAAAQGLMAGLNASLSMRGLPPLVLARDEAYIGVLIDDLVTKGTNEPYRMMTSRAEYRIRLRQDNADFRLTEKAMYTGLISEQRKAVFESRKQALQSAKEQMAVIRSPKEIGEFMAERGITLNSGLSYADMVRRGVTVREIRTAFGTFANIPEDVLDLVETDARYEGYLKKEADVIEKAKKLEEKPLPEDIDYLAVQGLRLEARQKLDRIRPRNLGQAARISGVSPADIAVLMVYLKK